MIRLPVVGECNFATRTDIGYNKLGFLLLTSIFSELDGEKSL